MLLTKIVTVVVFLGLMVLGYWLDARQKRKTYDDAMKRKAAYLEKMRRREREDDNDN